MNKAGKETFQEKLSLLQRMISQDCINTAAGLAQPLRASAQFGAQLWGSQARPGTFLSHGVLLSQASVTHHRQHQREQLSHGWGSYLHAWRQLSEQEWGCVSPMRMLGKDLPGPTSTADTRGRCLCSPPWGWRTLPAGLCCKGAAGHKAGGWGGGMAHARR